MPFLNFVIKTLFINLKIVMNTYNQNKKKFTKKKGNKWFLILDIDNFFFYF